MELKRIQTEKDLAVTRFRAPGVKGSETKKSKIKTPSKMEVGGRVVSPKRTLPMKWGGCRARTQAAVVAAAMAKLSGRFFLNLVLLCFSCCRCFLRSLYRLGFPARQFSRVREAKRGEGTDGRTTTSGRSFRGGMAQTPICRKIQ